MLGGKGRSSGAQGREPGVTDLTEWRRRRNMTDANSVTREDCIGQLRRLAPMSDEQAALLGIPPRLYRIGESSFSSEAGNGIAKAAGALMLGGAFPPGLPDFGMHISSRGSNTFCTLVDRGRGIVVFDDIKNMYAGDGSWSGFLDNLAQAARLAESYRRGGKRFEFVIMKEGSAGTV
jgi:hypothetical protein